MAFLRFNRDRRGYEHFQLVEPAVNRRRPASLLYWFRSPPNVRVGREPFDAAVRAALEQQYPDVQFDWPQILATPIPSAEAELWRERRRQERAARRWATAEREEEDATESVDAQSDTVEPMRDAPLPAQVEELSQRPGDLQRKHRRRRRSRRGRSERPPQGSAADEAPPTETPSDSWIGKERQS
jgi:hypothetical protein